MSNQLEITDVSKAFGGVQAVTRVSLDVRQGEILSVIGPNGATIAENEDIKEFYLGLSSVGQRKSYRDVKHYRRRKRWLS